MGPTPHPLESTWITVALRTDASAGAFAFIPGETVGEERGSAGIEGTQSIKLETLEHHVRPESHAALILGVVISVAFLDAVDLSVALVALPTIQRESVASLATS